MMLNELCSSAIRVDAMENDHVGIPVVDIANVDSSFERSSNEAPPDLFLGRKLRFELDNLLHQSLVRPLSRVEPFLTQERISYYWSEPGHTELVDHGITSGRGV